MISRSELFTTLIEASAGATDAPACAADRSATAHNATSRRDGLDEEFSCAAVRRINLRTPALNLAALTPAPDADWLLCWPVTLLSRGMFRLVTESGEA